MPQVIMALFERYDDADQVIRALTRYGLKNDVVSVVAHERGVRQHLTHDPLHAATAHRDGDPLPGATIGGLGGFLLGMAAIALPELGLVLVGGPFGLALAAAAVGAGLGARLSGDLAKTLIELGLSEAEAITTVDQIKHGAILISVEITPEQRVEVEDVLRNGHPSLIRAGVVER